MKRLKVVGVGKIEREPNKAIIKVKIVVRGKEYEEIIVNLNDKVESLIKGLKNIEIDSDNIKTNNFQVVIENKYDSQTNEYTFDNYKGEHYIDIEVHNKKEEINKVLSFLSSNNFNGNLDIEFRYSNMEELEEEALMRALLDGEEKAKIIENKLNIRIGGIEEVIYDGEGPVRGENQNFDNILLYSSKTADFNIMPKDIFLTRRVSISYGIK